MLDAALSLVLSSVTAAVPTTPLPWFEFRDYPMKAFEKKWEGVTRFDLVVAPDGSVADCTVTSSSGHEELDKTSCFLATKRAKFRPALDSSGKPTYGVYRTQAVWAMPEHQLANSAPGPDLEVSVNQLPQGTAEPPVVKLAYLVDPQGHASNCTLMAGAPPQPEQLVEIGCNQVAQRLSNAPVRDSSGRPVPAVRTAAVKFNAGS